MRTLRVLALVLACSVALVSAQPSAPPPMLTEVEQLRLQLLAERAENAALKLQRAQAQLEQASAQLSDTLTRHQRQGWRLERDHTGAWHYVATP